LGNLQQSVAVFILFNLMVRIYAQPSWEALPNAPNGPRHDDGYFINENLGWVVNGNGQIWKTTDGGDSWIKQFDKGTVYFRSTGFLDSLYGIAGNLGTEEFGGQTDTNLIYRTTDGGTTWNPINNFIGTKPRGVCGLSVINDSVIYGVGRVRGPVYFLKSTDKGATWITKDMSQYAVDLMDIHFSSVDSGFIVGGNGSPNQNSNGIILFTTDAGNSWTNVFTSSQLGEWCWKIDFPRKNIGYVSLQRNSGSPINFIKTTDGGKTWFEKRFTNFSYYVQGMGFANDTLGWAGGNSTYTTYETTDGGETWHDAGFGYRVNRFRLLNDSVGFAMGRTVYKYINRNPTYVGSELINEHLRFELKQNYPNPFNPTTIIEFSIPYGTEINSLVLLKIFDVLGNEIKTIFDEVKEPGNYKVAFDGSDLPSGVYFYKLMTENFSSTKKLILLK
jgi:photosystem II stability/assembly factor-like uncharacterized protein